MPSVTIAHCHLGARTLWFRLGLVDFLLFRSGNEACYATGSTFVLDIICIKGFLTPKSSQYHSVCLLHSFWYASVRRVVFEFHFHVYKKKTFL